MQLNPYLGKNEKLKINEISIHLKDLEKNNKVNPMNAKVKGIKSTKTHSRSHRKN